MLAVSVFRSDTKAENFHGLVRMSASAGQSRPDNEQQHRSKSGSSIWSAVAATFLLTALGTLWLELPDDFLARRDQTRDGDVGPLPLLQVSGPALSPDPAPGPIRPPHMIRVEVNPPGRSPSRIACDHQWKLHPVGSTEQLGGGDSLPATEVRPGKVGIRIGDKEYPVTRLELEPVEDRPAIWVGEHQFRGKVRIYRRSPTRLTFVNVLEIEDYIASVVDGEMPAAFPDAAREAQAIVARSYALYQQSTIGRRRLFDVYASTRSQKYLGYQYRTSSGRRLAGESKAGRAIADNTKGIIAVSDGRLFCTYYSAVCGGHTARGTMYFADADPMLRSLPCDWCREAKLYRWSRSVELSKFDQIVKRVVGKGASTWSGTQEVETVDSEGVTQVTVSDGNQSFTFGGDRLRTAIGASTMPSSTFELELKSDSIAITGRGHGHGVGLCQWGARGQALQGRSAARIVGYYYPRCQLRRLDYTR